MSWLGVCVVLTSGAVDLQDELALMDDDDVMAVGAKGEGAIRTLVNFMDLVYTCVWLVCAVCSLRARAAS